MIWWTVDHLDNWRALGQMSPGLDVDCGPVLLTEEEEVARANICRLLQKHREKVEEIRRRNRLVGRPTNKALFRGREALP